MACNEERQILTHWNDILMAVVDLNEIVALNCHYFFSENGCFYRKSVLYRPQKGSTWLVALAITMVRVIILSDTLRRSEGKFEGVLDGVWGESDSEYIRECKHML